MKKEDAELKLKRHIDKPLGFCPMIKAECKIDCVAFTKAYIRNVYSDVYSFHEESCNSPLINGFIFLSS